MARTVGLAHKMANQYSIHKMQDDTLQHLLMIGLGSYVAKLWWDDYRAAASNQPNPRSLPGATASKNSLIYAGTAAGIALVAAETVGEFKLGISSEQSTITSLFALYTLIAAAIEEIIFRGYIVVEKRGRWALWSSIVGASLLFAALHPFLWKWEGPWAPWDGGRLTWVTGLKGWYSTGIVFASSLVFYALRFNRFNTLHSLLPCIAAHAAKNLGVIAIKAYQGYLVLK